MWTNNDFIYRVDGNTYVLYSVGRNGRDDNAASDDSPLELPLDLEDLPTWIEENVSGKVVWIGGEK
jgi:hypothetical protein